MDVREAVPTERFVRPNAAERHSLILMLLTSLQLSVPSDMYPIPSMNLI